MSEFSLLRDTLEKSGVQVVLAHPDDPLETVWAHSPEAVLSGGVGTGRLVRDLLGAVEEHTVYKFTDAYDFCYIYFLFPSGELFFMGPYLPTAISTRTTLDAARERGLSEEALGTLRHFCLSIPILADDSHFFFLLDTFCEHLWEGAPFVVLDVEQEKYTPASPITRVGTVEHFDAVGLDMKLMEERYAYEAELMRAVTLGQTNKADLILSAFSEMGIEQRLPDSLRNLKNYCVIMNTLLRKAAQEGGVHPVYLDRVSSSFASEIERMGTVDDVPNMMRDMFRSYCRLVRRHSMKGYTPLVQNAIIYIESDLSANLTLSKLSLALKVSPGYLSTAFRRETKRTITEYIREKRMKHAAHLLATTHLQIQQVAAQCGIVDLQYFSKLFKRHTNQSPKEYRETHKQKTSV